MAFSTSFDSVNVISITSYPYNDSAVLSYHSGLIAKNIPLSNDFVKYLMAVYSFVYFSNNRDKDTV